MDCQQQNNQNNDFLSNLTNYNLYIDHQQLAPLIRLLEDTIDHAENQTDNNYSRLELRETIYQEFITIVNSLYGERFKEIKLEDQLPPLPQQEELLQQRLMLRPREKKHNNNRGFQADDNRQSAVRNTVKTRAIHSLQVEIELIQWIISCNKNTFDHKQIVEKYCEISKGTKKRLSIENIMNLLQKYNLRHMIVRGKQGKEHFFRQVVNQQPSIVVKEEEFSKIITDNISPENVEESEQAVKKDEQMSSLQMEKAGPSQSDQRQKSESSGQKQDNSPYQK